MGVGSPEKRNQCDSNAGRPAGALLAFVAFAICAFSQVSIVDAVRARIAQKDLTGAEQIARTFQSQTGPRPDLAAAYSWLARAWFDVRNLDRADTFAQEAGQMSARFLTAMKLDDDPWLPTAVGAAIEVHAQVLAARGERAEALAYLREQLKAHAATSLPERIRKNMNLLTLEGKPAPELDRAQWVGAVRPPSLAGLRGRPVLLFFWAHWCSDCKAEVGIVAALRKTFAAQQLAVIGPTRLYGYVQGGEEAPPERERQYIEKVRGQFYRPLADMPAPLSAANFVNYGASSTPTLVLIDRAGVVRWYHPGSATASELTERIRQLAAK